MASTCTAVCSVDMVNTLTSKMGCAAPRLLAKDALDIIESTENVPAGRAAMAGCQGDPPIRQQQLMQPSIIRRRTSY